MKAKIFFLLLLVFTAMVASGQSPSMELTYTAIDSASHVQLDSIKIMNRSQGGDTVLVYPDTVLIIDYVGIPEDRNASGLFEISCYPNPVNDQATISVFIPEEEIVGIRISDMLGRFTSNHRQKLEKGMHSFIFTPGAESLYLFSVDWKGNNRTIKIVSLSKKIGKTCSLAYSGYEKIEKQFKAAAAAQSFQYTPGDTLLYIGYSDTLQSGILDVPESSKTFTFQFATNIPCPGTPTVEYEGQVYNTIQIFSQCWLKKNLNVGIRIDGIQEQTDNGIMEKYCYGDMDVNCSFYGGLYQWNELMQYVSAPGVQGICPPDWHIATDEEWKVLESAVDSQYSMGDSIWDKYGYNGQDVALNLKASSGWYYGENGADLYGFTGFPGGYRYTNGSFSNYGVDGFFSSSSEFDMNELYHTLPSVNPRIYRGQISKEIGVSVRCIRDY